MTKIETKHEKELNRMYDKLRTLTPGTEEYKAVLDAAMKARDGEIERKKIEEDAKQSKRDLYVKIGTFGAGLLIAPIVDLVCKRNLTKFIGTIEQMEYFTSSAGKSISSWFRWK